ncbi:glycine zipper domain-containing protein [Haloparvum sp. AD34]
MVVTSDANGFKSRVLANAKRCRVMIGSDDQERRSGAMIGGAIGGGIGAAIGNAVARDVAE